MKIKKIEKKLHNEFDWDFTHNRLTKRERMLVKDVVKIVTKNIKQKKLKDETNT